MFVSFLQRFGFLAPSAASEPIKSPANKADKKRDGRIIPAPVLKAEGHPQANAQRRQVVKAPAKKTKAVVKVPASKVGKTAQKVAVKKAAVQKTLAPKVVKPALKPAAKVSLVKSVAVPKASVAPKLTTKEVVNQKAANKSVIKPVVKPAVKAAQPVVKSAVKSTLPSKSPSSVKAALPSAAKAASIPTKPALAPQPSAPPAPKTMITPPPALKPGRRSSARTAALSPPPAPMVPTHAPDAAKASYSTITERVISPPPHVAARKDPKLANNWKTKEASELTDEEVKAMADSEYMNDKQLAFFRNKLSILKSEIHASAGQTTENLREDTVVVPDPADRATIEEEHALELRTRDRERKLLKKIEQSISRIDAGDYGYCDETGEAIGVGRLIARPTASLSLEAQQRRELKQKLFGD